jgi:KTSC domain
MERLPLHSTTLSWASYSSARRLLQLGFHTGNVYEYFDVPMGTFQELLRADSQGRYFNLYIRNHFRTQRVLPAGIGTQN